MPIDDENALAFRVSKGDFYVKRISERCAVTHEVILCRAPHLYGLHDECRCRHVWINESKEGQGVGICCRRGALFESPFQRLQDFLALTNIANTLNQSRHGGSENLIPKQGGVPGWLLLTTGFESAANQ
jgi:hypothetical protein